MQSTSQSVKDAAAKARPQATVTVDYDSSRSDEPQTVEGAVERVAAFKEGGQIVCKITFRRDDGQYMIVSSDGAVESVGSHFPRTGTATNVEIHVPASCPGCGEETHLNEDGEAVFCGGCSAEILTDGYRRHPFKATAGVGDR